MVLEALLIKLNFPLFFWRRQPETNDSNTKMNSMCIGLSKAEVETIQRPAMT